ncbi:probable WRKY transcription factor 35 [Solanum dulcamara]|uniref:probable WRKY transcription factor 35 n=1 Tax=Solanum dulcamara TaxID=45834 RepID=UPI00248579BF|nr:probable WRKY transcription factor 35 [Solanum dulcamara]XP_055804686.1 probable WRKY transcription factor 35 [Solanum dulcamara]
MFFTSVWCKTYQTDYQGSNQESGCCWWFIKLRELYIGKACAARPQKKVMENNYQGDLADIFRGGNNSTSGESSSTTVVPVPDGWQFPYSASHIEEPTSGQEFGDPFCNLRDPLFHDLDMMQATQENNNNNNEGTSIFGDSPSMKRRSNMFSRMLQISPTTKLAMSPSDVSCSSPNNVIGALLPNHDAISSSKTSLLENSALQISSPRNTGIKRRKSQAKKVVCIPAAAPANSRQGGEVVPSDLWAWRKYGQKPIKGSPYPRGYYRCSSSKGCSARKQVERSRTDPNMLVITYTSEHNHPWPTQRNALAGSTRSQPNNSKHTNNIIIPNNSQSQTDTSFKEDDQKESGKDNVGQVNISTYPKVKEEAREEDGHHQQVEMRDDEFSKDSYQPILPHSSNQCHEDFFADLVELEADPLNLLFAKTLSGDINEVGQKKAIESFNLYDWSKDRNSTSNNKPDT